MRRQWYLGFAIILLAIFLLFAMSHDIIWFTLFSSPLVILGVYDFLQKKKQSCVIFPF